MLELIRQYRAAFTVIFIIAAVGLVVTMFDAPGAGGMRSGGMMSSGVVAKVEGSEIRTSELIEAVGRQMEQAERAMSAQLQKAGNTPEARKFMESYLRSQVTPDRVLQSLIQRQFLMTTAEVSGMVAPSDAIRDRIHEMEAFRDKQGRFDPVLYRQMVPSPAAFERELATQALFESFRGAFYAGLGAVSPAESAEASLFAKERVFEMLVIRPRRFPEPAKADPQAVAAFAADAASKTKLQAYYDAHRDEYERGESVRARHILVREEGGGLKKTQEILADLRAGKTSFESAAKAHSADKSNAGMGGDLGYFERGRMDPAFEKAAFELKKANELSEPVKTAFGYHIIQFVDRKPEVKRPMEQVQNEIAEKVWLETKRTERAQAWIQSWLPSGKVPDAKELKRLGLEWKKLAPWTPLEDRLGQMGSVDPYLPELLKLGPTKPVLSQAIPQGEDMVVIRWSETKAPSADRSAPAAIASEKIDEAFQYYMRRRFEDLEKKRKIVTSEKALGQLRQQFAAPQG